MFPIRGQTLSKPLRASRVTQLSCKTLLFFRNSCQLALLKRPNFAQYPIGRRKMFEPYPHIRSSISPDTTEVNSGSNNGLTAPAGIPPKHFESLNPISSALTLQLRPQRRWNKVIGVCLPCNKQIICRNY